MTLHTLQVQAMTMAKEFYKATGRPLSNVTVTVPADVWVYIVGAAKQMNFDIDGNRVFFSGRLDYALDGHTTLTLLGGA